MSEKARGCQRVVHTIIVRSCKLFHLYSFHVVLPPHPLPIHKIRYNSIIIIIIIIIIIVISF